MSSIMGSDEKGQFELGDLTSGLLGKKDAQKKLAAAKARDRPVRHSEVKAVLERCRDLNKKCGGTAGSKEDDEEEVDTSSMSPFELSRYELTKTMKQLRDDMVKLDKLESQPFGSKSEPIILKNGIRRTLATCTKKKKEMNDLAAKEGRQSDAEKVTYHLDKTERAYKGHFSAPGMEALDVGAESAARADTSLRPSRRGGGGGAAGGGGGGGGGAMPSHLEPGGGDFESIMNEPEFQQLFEEVRQKDTRMDEALDEIHEGVKRLGVHANSMKDEMDLQDQLMNDIETGVDKHTEELMSLNSKLEKAVASVKKESMCIYCICCLLLIGIISGIVVIAKGKL